MQKFIIIIALSVSFFICKQSSSYKGQLNCQSLSHNMNDLLIDFPDGRIRNFCNAAELSCERFKQLKILENAIQTETPKNQEALKAFLDALSANVKSQLALDLDMCELGLFSLFPDKYRQKFLAD